MNSHQRRIARRRYERGLAEWQASAAKDCSCSERYGVCAGVLAGGPCDRMGSLGDTWWEPDSDDPEQIDDCFACDGEGHVEDPEAEHGELVSCDDCGGSGREASHA